MAFTLFIRRLIEIENRHKIQQLFNQILSTKWWPISTIYTSLDKIFGLFLFFYYNLNLVFFFTFFLIWFTFLFIELNLNHNISINEIIFPVISTWKLHFQHIFNWRNCLMEFLKKMFICGTRKQLAVKSRKWFGFISEWVSSNMRGHAMTSVIFNAVQDKHKANWIVSSIFFVMIQEFKR